MTETLQDRLKAAIEYHAANVDYFADDIGDGVFKEEHERILEQKRIHVEAMRDALEALDCKATISDEAVEVAAQALDKSAWTPSSDESLQRRLDNRKLVARNQARAALTAAAPYMAGASKESDETVYTPAHLREIRRCVEQERERCAKAAETEGLPPRDSDYSRAYNDGYAAARKDIAASIRQHKDGK